MDRSVFPGFSRPAASRISSTRLDVTLLFPIVTRARKSLEVVSRRDRLKEDHQFGRGAHRDLRVAGVGVCVAVVDRDGGGDEDIGAGGRPVLEVRSPVDRRVIEPGVEEALSAPVALSPTNATWRSDPLATTEGWSNTQFSSSGTVHREDPFGRRDGGEATVAATTCRKRLRNRSSDPSGGASAALLDAPKSPL